jgi:5-methylcytosine-specific restriction endonuclease McrA
MTETEFPGWTKVGTRELFHCCGARIRKPRGKRLWTALTVAGASVSGFSDAASALAWLEKNDDNFWSYGRWWTGGTLAGVDFNWGSHDRERKQTLIVCSVPDGQDFPAHLQSPLRRLFLRKAVCAKCGRESTAIQLRRLTYLESSGGGHRHYVVCACGHPVWRMTTTDSFAVQNGILRAGREWERRVKLTESGGKHSRKEIEEIRSLQENRCIYCNEPFTEARKPTKDHLVPIVYGGTNWSLNIVLACLQCNCRRNDIPFRTYRTLLSKAQNQRIESHLRKRVHALDTGKVPSEVVDAFFVGLYLDDPQHPRYVQILSGLAIARKKAATNRRATRF